MEFLVAFPFDLPTLSVWMYFFSILWSSRGQSRDQTAWTPFSFSPIFNKDIVKSKKSSRSLYNVLMPPSCETLTRQNILEPITIVYLTFPQGWGFYPCEYNEQLSISLLSADCGHPLHTRSHFSLLTQYSEKDFDATLDEWMRPHLREKWTVSTSVAGLAVSWIPAVIFATSLFNILLTHTL